MKTRKPKPPSNAEIYNLLVMIHQDMQTLNRQVIHLQTMLYKQPNLPPRYTRDEPYSWSDR